MPLLQLKGGCRMTLSKEEKERVKAARSAYMREYRQRPENKKKQKEYQERHWLKKAQEMSAEEQ